MEAIFSLRLSLLVFIQPVFILHTLSLKSTLNSEPRGRRKVRWLLCQPEEALKVGGACQQCGKRGERWFRGSLSELMMLLAAITKASLTYTNTKVLPSPWGSGFDFLGCRPPPAHSDHSKERPRRRSLGQRRVFSRPVSLWLRGYISGNVVSSSDNEPHYPACVNVYTRVTSKKKSGCTNLSTCVNMFGWSRRGPIARCAPRFVRANAAPRCASVQSVWSWRERSARSTEACTCRQNLLVFKSQDARRPFAIKTSLPVVVKQQTILLPRPAHTGRRIWPPEFWKQPLYTSTNVKYMNIS